jgi:hypothetical protein
MYIYDNVFHMLAFGNGFQFKWFYNFWSECELVMNYQFIK